MTNWFIKRKQKEEVKLVTAQKVVARSNWDENIKAFKQLLKVKGKGAIRMQMAHGMEQNIRDEVKKAESGKRDAVTIETVLRDYHSAPKLVEFCEKELDINDAVVTAIAKKVLNGH